MKKSLDQLTSEVSILLGESISSECFPEESPFPDLAQRVRILAPSLLGSILKEAPVELCGILKSIPASGLDHSETETTLKLPDDFLKIGTVKMSGWICEASEISPLSSLASACESSGLEGVKASRSRPAILLTYRADGSKALRLCPANKEDRLEYALYVAVPTISDSGFLEIPDPLYDVLLKALVDKMLNP